MEARVARRIAQCLADAVHGGVHTVVVVDKGAVRPKLAGNLLAGEQFARAVQQQAQHLEGLSVQLYADALPAQLAPIKGSASKTPNR
jgi:hypothetical protein